MAYYGEIRAFVYDFAPVNWLSCNGQTLRIDQYTALYSLLGESYHPGTPDGVHFYLPNLNGRAIMGTGTGAGLTPAQPGDTYGEDAVTLTQSQLPNHKHDAFGAIGAQKTRVSFPTDNTSYISNFSYTSASNVLTSALGYVSGTSGINAHLSTQTLTNEGGGGAHENRQPCLSVNYCICVYGDEFPTRP